MKILALETAVDPASVALWLDGKIVVHVAPDNLTNSAALLPAADAMLRKNGLEFSRLDGIAFGSGPGAFTGLRVACGVAQGLAIALDKPLLGIGTLEAMAQAAGENVKKVIVTLDARMGEVYYGRFVEGLLQGGIGVCSPESLPLPADGGWRVCGNGIHQYPVLRDRLAGVTIDWKADILPDAGFIARLAGPRMERGERLDPALAAPLYVRDKVARTVAERLAEGGKA